MRKRYFVLIFSGLCLLSTIKCSRQNPEALFRIGFFPNIELSSQKSSNLIVSEIIAKTFRQIQSNQIMIVPPDWINSAIQLDSLNSATYLQKHFKRIGLHRCILVNVKQTINGSFVIEFDDFDLINNTELTYQFNGPLLIIMQNLTNRVFNENADFCSCSLSCLNSDQLNLSNEALWRILKQNYTEAANQWQLINQKNPNCLFYREWYIKSLLSLALVYKVENQSNMHLYLQAMNHIKQLSDSTCTNLNYLKGRYFLQQEMWNQAELFLKKADEQDANNPMILLDIAQLHPSRYADLGFRNKEQLLKYILTLYPGLDEGWLELGDFYFSKQYKQKAEAVYQKWLQIHPGSIDALLALGKLYLLADDIPRLIQTYEKILSICPESPEAFYNLGIAYFRNEQFETAERFFVRALQYGQYPDIHYYLGVLAFSKTDYSEAKLQFQKRLDLRSGINDEFADESIRMIRKIDQLVKEN